MFSDIKNSSNFNIPLTYNKIQAIELTYTLLTSTSFTVFNTSYGKRNDTCYMHTTCNKT